MQFVAIVGVGWLVLAALCGFVVGPALKRLRKSYPKPPEHPHIPQQRQESPDLSEPRSAGRKPRTREQRWPYGRKYDS